MPWPVNATRRAWWRSSTTMPAAEALDEIQQRQNRIETLAQAQHAAVVKAREHGASWSQIGAAIGITKQAAQKRYDRRLF